MRILAALLLCVTLGACLSPISGGDGLSDVIVDAYSGPSFDAQIAPSLQGFCTDGEIATLRQTHIDVTRAINNSDIDGAQKAVNRLYGVSQTCSSAYRQVAAAQCRQTAIDSWQPGSEPYESALARARNCG